MSTTTQKIKRTVAHRIAREALQGTVEHLVAQGIDPATITEAGQDLFGTTPGGVDNKNAVSAVLTGAYLSGANLRGAHLSGAKANTDTVWPEGFDPAAAGVVTEEDEQ